MDLAWRRLVQQRLVGAQWSRPEDVVDGLVAVQAQDPVGATWAIAQRTTAGAGAAVARAFDDGRILRTHVLRPTWHHVTPADLRWLLALTAPRIHAMCAGYYRQQGLDAATVRRARTRLERALAGRQLTRAELGRVLGEAGRPLAGERLAWFLMRAELDAVICSGPLRGKQHTYALVDDRVPSAAPLARDEALATLARRYVAGHGPAQAHDLAWWSGFTVADARRGLDAAGGALTRELIDGKTHWSTPPPPSPRRRGPVVHLLPNYDELVIALKDRSAMFDPRIERTPVFSAHFVVVDGRIVGTWYRTVSPHEVVVEAHLLRPLSPAEHRGLDRAAARYGDSLGLPARITRG